jgi:hypothetical protein
MKQHTDIYGQHTPDWSGPHVAADEGDMPHECEFCSPEPEIMPLPRSGAVRFEARQSDLSAQEAFGELRS